MKFHFYFVLFLTLLLGGCKKNYKIYWGDVHCHTTFSDGTTPIDSVLTFAKDSSGLDFVIITDHDFGHETPWRLSKKTWQIIQKKTNSYTQKNRFIAIPGYEWTSQRKYWKNYRNGTSEQLFDGEVKGYNHKNVYFPTSIDSIFSAKDILYYTPNLLAEAVKKQGGLIQNNHPTENEEGQDQWDYNAQFESVITNTEINTDDVWYDSVLYHINFEKQIREFLNYGRKTGFVGGTDSHDGRPAARTAIFAKELTRDAIFDALRNRRNYAVTNARIELDFRINGHLMGEEIKISGKPLLVATIRGTDKIQKVSVIRDGAVIYSEKPMRQNFSFQFVDQDFGDNSYYYLRVVQVDKDKQGNYSRAWSSPIWVK